AHQVLVKSPLIVERAINKRGLAGLQSVQGEVDDLTEVIGKKLTVTRSRGASGTNNNILDISCRAAVPEESALILDAVIECYKDFLDETYRNMSDDTLELVTKARDVIQKDLGDKETAYEEFRRKTPV